MVKSNTPSRDMRAVQRDLRKIKNELVQTKQKAAGFKHMVYNARDRATIKFCVMNTALLRFSKERDTLLKSLTNFNKSCNKQKQHILQQDYDIGVLRKTVKQLYLVNRSLRSISTHEVQKSNPHLCKTVRKANI
jgi:hypothetical protein